MNISFCSHFHIYNESIISDYLKEEIEKVIVKGDESFYFNMFSDFDFIAYCIIDKLKNTKYPNIKIIIVTDHVDNDRLKYRDYDNYNVLLLENDEVNRRRLKVMKNITDNSDYVICFVSNVLCVSYKIYNYIKKKNIKYTNLNKHFYHMFKE